MKDSRLLYWGRLLLAGAILFFLIKQLFRLLTGLDSEPIAFQPLWFLMSFAVLLSYKTLLVYPWRILYRSVSAELPPAFQVSWMLCQLSQLGKYVPGKVGQFLGIIALCRPLGVSKTAAVVSTLQGLVFQCVLGFGMGVPVLLSQEATPLWDTYVTGSRLNALPLIGLAVLLIVLGGVFLILLCKGRFLKKMEFFRSVRAIFSVSLILQVLAVYFLLWISFGIAFFAFVKSLAPAILPRHFLMITGIYPLAWSIGFLSFITPGGLGVREGILGVLLSLCLPAATATLVALLSRVWVMGAEIVLASIAGGFYYRWNDKKVGRYNTCESGWL